MRLDFINPSTLIPAQNADAATAAVIQNPQPLSNVVPTFNLPEEGAKPEDKEKQEQQRLAEQAGEGENGEEQQVQVPEIFKLVMNRDFRELLKFYLGVDEKQLWITIKKARLFNDVENVRPVSGFYTRKSDSEAVRDNLYKETLFYHYSSPGSRFKGAM